MVLVGVALDKQCREKEGRRVKHIDIRPCTYAIAGTEWFGRQRLVWHLCPLISVDNP